MKILLSAAMMLFFVGTASGSSAAATAGASQERHPGHHGESQAERACRKAVAHTLGGDARARDLRVISTEESQAGTSVRIEVPGAEAPWACMINADGMVEDVYYTSEG